MGRIWRDFGRTASVIECGLAIVAIPVGVAFLLSGRSYGWWLVGGGAVMLIAAGLDGLARR